jgi:hypothetical protein
MQVLGLADSTPKTTSRLRELFWPNLTTEPNAQSACETASLTCFFVAAVTVIFALASAKAGLLDAALFTVIGFGLRKMWRTAAVAGFALYLLEHAYPLSQGQYPGGLSILIAVILFNGMRASFAYRRMYKAAAVVGVFE